MTEFSTQLSGRALALVRGADAESFLQGLLTCDMAGLGEGMARYGALLSAQGKILYDIVIVKLSEGYLIDCAGFARQALLERFGFYKLRSKVEFLALDGGVAAGTGAAPPGAIVDPRTPLLGWRHYGVNRGAEDFVLYEAHRIGLGVADSAADIGSGTLFPHEANLDGLAGVSFSKGCYVGQEIVSRTEHRGMARSRIIIAEFDGEAPEAGTSVTDGDKPLGTILSHSGNVALALMRLDRLADSKGVPMAMGRGVRFRVAPWARYGLNGHPL
jgi:folate-binding protein YgfZ